MKIDFGMISLVVVILLGMLPLRSLAQRDSLELYKQLIEMQAKQEVLSNEIQTMNSRFDDLQTNFNLVFGVMAGFISLLYGLTSYMQYRRELKGEKIGEEIDEILKAQNDKHEKYIKTQDEVTKDLLNSSQKNIDQITELLKSLDGMFKMSKDMQEMQAKYKNFAEDLEAREQREKVELEKALLTVNESAMIICSELTRDNYKTSYNEERFRNYRHLINKKIKVDFKSEKRLNANTFLILAFDLIHRNLFLEAIDMLAEAVKRAKYFSENDSGDIVYPVGHLAKQGIKKWNKKLVNICLFHRAIVHYNLGEHKIAEGLFREAVDFDGADVLSMLYIPEAKYLGQYDSFKGVEEAFLKVQKVIENISPDSNWSKTKNSMMSLYYVKLGNLYFPGSKNNFFGEGESLKKAATAYKNAYRANQDSYVAKFSYAQVLSKMAKMGNALSSDSKKRQFSQKANELFRETFELVEEKIGETTETKILIMLYYIIVICCYESNLGADKAGRYISKILEKSVDLPSVKGFRIFSPLTKNDLTFDELKEEINAFENSFAQPLKKSSLTL